MFQLTAIEVEFLFGIICVAVAGFLIGIERGGRGEPAGVRTQTLVCFGSMVFTLLSRYSEPSNPGRIAASIVTGIGFLGAGIILHQKGSIRGLTTSASIWFSAAIGMSIGFGYYIIGLVSAICAFYILKLPHVGEHRDQRRRPGKFRNKV